MSSTAPKRIAPILGALGALGPLAIDMYLPGLPAIAADLGANEAALQFSVMAFFAGLMLGQLFYGPLSDRTGRKPMIQCGLSLFALASLGCAAASSANALIVWRFVQGLGGSIGMVIGMAVVRDLYIGRDAARLVALIMLVMGLAPVLAPLAGSALMVVAGWQAVFVAQAAYAFVCLALTARMLPETRLPELRAASHPADALRHYLHLAGSRRYVPYVATLALAQAGFFAYLAGSSFVFISVHRLSPTAYSLVFALNSLGLVAGTQAAPRLMGRFRPEAIVRGALAVYVSAALLLLALQFGGGAGIGATTALLFVSITAMSLVLPLCGVLALESYGAISGTAAALMGGCQFGGAVIASLVSGLFANGTATPMMATIAAAGLAAGLVALFAFPAAPVPAPQPRQA